MPEQVNYLHDAAYWGAAIKQIPERTANKKKLGFPVPLNDWLRQDNEYAIGHRKVMEAGGI